MSIEDVELVRRFAAVRDGVARRWGEKTYEWLERNRPDLSVAAEASQITLDRAWVALHKGQGPEMDFSMALIGWGKAHLDALAAWEAADQDGKGGAS